MAQVIYGLYEGTTEEFEKRHKLNQFKQKVKQEVNNVWNFVKENKEILLVLVPSVCGVATASVKAVSKHANLKKEENNKNLYCYDRSLGHYWKLRRELTNDEWVEIDKRKRNGERLADILDELKVLK